MLGHHAHVANLSFGEDRLDDASRSLPVRSVGHEDAIAKDRSTDLGP